MFYSLFLWEAAEAPLRLWMVKPMNARSNVRLTVVHIVVHVGGNTFKIQEASRQAKSTSGAAQARPGWEEK